MRDAEAVGDVVRVKHVVVVVPDAARVEESCYGGGYGVSGTGECGFSVGGFCGGEVCCVFGQAGFEVEGVCVDDAFELGVLEVRVVIFEEG